MKHEGETNRFEFEHSTTTTEPYTTHQQCHVTHDWFRNGKYLKTSHCESFHTSHSHYMRVQLSQFGLVFILVLAVGCWKHISSESELLDWVDAYNGFQMAMPIRVRVKEHMRDPSRTHNWVSRCFTVLFLELSCAWLTQIGRHTTT